MVRLVNRGGSRQRLAALQFNEQQRKQRRTFATPDHSGHVAFNMPQMDFWWWTSVKPELAAADPDIAKRAWLKFLNSDEGAKYKVNPKEGKRAAVDRVIVR